MKKEEIKIAVIGSNELPIVIDKEDGMVLAEFEVSASLDTLSRTRVVDDISLHKDAKTLLILQKIEHIDPEILKREIRNDKSWKTQKWRKKLK
jgi:hypothetical protein